MDVYLAKGTRDFLPEQMHNRLQVIETLRAVFTRYGFEPLATPAFERIETLMGKYGDEGDKLIFKILKRGEGGERGEVDQALRYDLTVPLARFMAMNRDIRTPFKRYQIQPVWRADRPQKGRFREFWQCDVDIVGSEQPLADAECLAVLATSLNELGFTEYTIRLNDRRILADLARRAGATTDREEMSVLISLDKLDKIGRDGVTQELLGSGFEQGAIDELFDTLRPAGDDAATLALLERDLDERGEQGVATLREVLAAAETLGVPLERVTVDPTLARGLDYYTGPVFEAAVVEPDIGSIAGGGRYDGLIGMFSGEDIPAVGVSLGMERIITVMQELGMLPETRSAARVFVTVFSDETRAAATKVATRLRAADIPTDLYLGDSRLRTQFKHANARGYPWLVIVGPDEAAQDSLALKNMKTGKQRTLSSGEAVEFLREASG